MSTRTFFRYYPTKADVLLRDQVERRAMVEAFLAARPPHEPIMESLRALMWAVSDELPPIRHLLQAQFRWSEESDLLLAAIRNHHAQVVDVVTDFIASRLDTPDPLGGRARAIATACIATLLAVSAEWLLADPAPEKPDIQSGIESLEAEIVVPG